MGSHHDVSDTKEDEEPLLKTTGEVAAAKEAPPSVAGGHFGSVVGGGFTHYSGVCLQATTFSSSLEISKTGCGFLLLTERHNTHACFPPQTSSVQTPPCSRF